MTEINESDNDFNIVSVTVTKKGENGEKMKNLLKKCLREEVIKILEGFSDEIRTLD